MWNTILLLITLAGCSRAADVVILANGDRFSGSVQKLEDRKLLFKTKWTEAALQIDWSEVTVLTTESDRKMTLVNGTEVSAKRIGPDAIPAASIAALARETSGEPDAAPGWLGRAWKNSSISADFDQSYSGLTGYNQLSSNTEIDYQGDRWDGSLVTHYECYGATGPGSTYQAYGRFLAQRYIHGDRFFLFPYGFLGRQIADTGSGQIRQYGGGAGWTFRRQEPSQVSLYAGLVRSTARGYTTLADDVRVDSRLDEPLYIAAVSWDGKAKHGIATSVRLYYFKPVLEPGHHSLATDASIKVPLVGPIYFTVHAYDTPELRQRHLFSTKNLQMSSGIGVSF